MVLVGDLTLQLPQGQQKHPRTPPCERQNEPRAGRGRWALTRPVSPHWEETQNDVTRNQLRLCSAFHCPNSQHNILWRLMNNPLLFIRPPFASWFPPHLQCCLLTRSAPGLGNSLSTLKSLLAQDREPLLGCPAALITPLLPPEGLWGEGRSRQSSMNIKSEQEIFAARS